MSRKIIGVTVGTQLPKPNFKQTDPTKGDYIRNKPDFEGLKTQVNEVSNLVGDTSVSTQIANAVSEKSQVQIVEQDVSEFLPTLTIHKLTQAEYDQKLAAGELDEAALYLTPDEEIDLSGYATENYVDLAVAAMVDSAPDTLNTLNELAAALGDDPNFATTVATQIGGKVDKVEGKGLSENDYTTAEKNKLANVADGANKIIVDSELSETSANPVQNKVVSAAISELNTLVGDTKVSVQISTAIEGIAHPVTSVNGKTGTVQLCASDVGALPDTTPIPSIAGLATESYVDSAISSISTPDVSGQINAHNTDAASHSDIRTQLSTRAAASDVSELQNLVGDTKVSVQISEAVAQKSQVQIITWEVDD